MCLSSLLITLPTLLFTAITQYLREESSDLELCKRKRTAARCGRLAAATAWLWRAVGSVTEQSGFNFMKRLHLMETPNCSLGERLDSYICSEKWLEYSPSNANARCALLVGSGKKPLFSLTNSIKITTDWGKHSVSHRAKVS